MALGDGGLDAQVEQRMDAYRGNPQKLQQRYGQNKELLDLLALQKLTSEKKQVAADMQLKAENNPNTIAQQREAEALQLTKSAMGGTLGELAGRTKGFSYRVLKEDCLDLPEKIYMKRHVALTKEQENLYEQMRKTAIANLNGKVTSTVTVLTQLMRLQQITCGHFVADDGTVQTIKNNRLDELIDVLEETENKAIIWAYWQRDVQDIKDAIEKKYGPRSVVDYYGLTPQDERQDNIRRFQNDNECRFLIGTPSTGGYGITLTEANTVIYYSNGYDLEKRLQSEDRAHRIGQKKNVTYIDLIAEDTVDEKIVKSLRKKINIASEVMGEELRDWI